MAKGEERQGWYFWSAASLAATYGGVIAYLALRKSPFLATVPWMPKAIARWADHSWAFRNFPAFAACALFCALPFASRPRWVLYVGAVIALFGTALEVAQIWIPTRFFDWADIGWSVAGAAVGTVAVFVLSGRKWLR